MSAGYGICGIGCYSIEDPVQVNIVCKDTGFGIRDVCNNLDVINIPVIDIECVNPMRVKAYFERVVGIRGQIS